MGLLSVFFGNKNKKKKIRELILSGAKIIDALPGRIQVGPRKRFSEHTAGPGRKKNERNYLPWKTGGGLLCIKMKKLNTLLLVFAVSTNFACGQDTDTLSKHTVIHVSSEEFKEVIAKEEGVIIDLRTPDEVKKGYIKGAIVMDYLDQNKDFEKEIEKLDKTKTYFIYCESGGRSGDAAELMQKQGFKKVYNLKNGFFNWKKKGFDYIKP